MGTCKTDLEWVDRYCKGKEYKTCLNSGCEYSSCSGCMSPDRIYHPDYNIRTQKKPYFKHKVYSDN